MSGTDLFKPTSTPTESTSTSTSSSEMPYFLQQAISQQINSAVGIANQPYYDYPFARVADLTDYQKTALGNVMANQGNWESGLGAAETGISTLAQQPGQTAAQQPYLEKAAGMSGLANAQPSLNQQVGILNALNLNQPAETLNANQNRYISPDLASALLQAGQTAYGAAGTMDIAGAASPYLTTAGALSGLQNASPFLLSSARSSAANVGQYMNPYNTAVTDQIAQLGARNLQEKLLPGVSDAFIRAGQFGGTRMGEFGSRALRDTQEAILNQQAQALQQGYGQALTTSQADLARQAQIASTIGQLTGQQQQNLTNIGQIGGQLTGQQMAALTALGQAQTGAGEAQQKFGLEAAQNIANAQQQSIAQGLQQAGQYGALGSTIGGLTLDQQKMLAGLGTSAAAARGADISSQMGAFKDLAALAEARQSMAAKDVSALDAAGQEQQLQKQKELDMSYQEKMDEVLYNQRQADWLNTQIRGLAPIIPQQTTTSNVTTGTTPGTSPLAQIAGVLAGVGGIKSLIGG